MVERKNLELSVRDFGPIARAEIDLRPLTVFVGPSNTGKSYLAILIYALHRFFHRHIYDSGITRSIPDPYMSDEQISELIQWADAIYSQSEAGRSPSEGTYLIYPDSIGAFLRPYLRSIDASGDLLHGEMARCFGVADTYRLARHSSRNGVRISMKRGFSNYSDPIEPFVYRYMIARKGYEFIASIPDKTPLFFENVDNDEIEDIRERALYIRHSLSQAEYGEDWRLDLVFLVNHLVRLAESYIRYPLNQRAHYLPADRAGVMHYHRVAIGSLIQWASYTGIQQEKPLPLISGVIADFMEQLTALDSDKISLHSLSREIERKILMGGASLKNSATGYPMFYYRPEGWKEDMPLMNTSSMVSELAPVVLYLRHVVQPGETLIIEEPESHLHPALQVEFTRQLAAVVRAGVRVIITTHSEWVLEELANLVNLSGLPESRREGIGGADYALSPDQLGVWLFEPKNRPRGSVVKEIPFDKEFGGSGRGSTWSLWGPITTTPLFPTAWRRSGLNGWTC